MLIDYKDLLDPKPDRIKIKFLSNYDSSENLLNRFMANYDVYDDVLDFSTTNNYDFVVVFNRTQERINVNAKVITVIQEPSWSPIHMNNPFLTNSDYLIIHDHELFENLYHIKLGKNIFEAPAYMFYHDHVERAFFERIENAAKTKKLSIIMSSLNWNVGNYAKRLNLLRKILASDLDIDIYGRGFSIPDIRFKGVLEYKYTGLLPYEYSIAIENSNEKNYITEKFVDCVLCDTIPIYCGAPNIASVYNPKYFQTLNLDSPTVIDDIKEIIKSPAPKPDHDSNKNRYFKQRNLYTIIKDIVQNYS